ncbi:hypothetical protein IF1G_10161 [Cordyceps javanica]|uniref:F-box domain-containing protein n=1 Tax=Cordyceps javanica TaxID=43265 RepID=A0A545UP85_9HYPO|nr:hypothetical protein IF1G_10161 [Cordyceps javanica]TQW02926.1 hypothetical protein IF2G_09443 [Cordyceps javanica]
MSVSIDGLSVELVQLVILHLNARGVAALRLTNRAVNSRILQTNYIRRFKTRRLWLDAASLQAFEQLTGRADVRLLPQNLIILGIARFCMEVADETEQHRTLLARAFANLRKRTGTGSLASIVLNVSVPEEEGIFLLEKPFTKIDSWTYIWQVAHQTFTTVFGALGETGLEVTRKLDLFTIPASCSLCYTDFIDIPKRFPGVLNSLRGLKELKASLSPPTKVPPDMRRFDLEEEFNGINPRNILQDIARALVVIAPAVESILFHWSDLNKRWQPLLDEPDASFVARGMQLQRCSLQGFKVSEMQLLAFLEHSCPASLELEYVQMYQGSWGPILQYISSKESGVYSYKLDDLTQGHDLVHFNAPGRPKFSYRENFTWPSAIARDGDLAKEPIEHCFMSGRGSASPGWHLWRARKLARFSISLDFVLSNPQELVEYRDLIESESEHFSSYRTF